MMTQLYESARTLTERRKRKTAQEKTRKFLLISFRTLARPVIDRYRINTKLVFSPVTCFYE